MHLSSLENYDCKRFIQDGTLTAITVLSGLNTIPTYSPVCKGCNAVFNGIGEKKSITVVSSQQCCPLHHQSAPLALLRIIPFSSPVIDISVTDLEWTSHCCFKAVVEMLCKS